MQNFPSSLTPNTQHRLWLPWGKTSINNLVVWGLLSFSKASSALKNKGRLNASNCLTRLKKKKSCTLLLWPKEQSKYTFHLHGNIFFNERFKNKVPFSCNTIQKWIVKHCSPSLTSVQHPMVRAGKNQNKITHPWVACLQLF